jgi:hypothetical protein
MTRFLGRLFAARIPRTTKPARRVSLNVERLESREVPTAVSGVNVNVSQIISAIAHQSTGPKTNPAVSNQQILMQHLQQEQQLMQQIASLLAQAHNSQLTTHLRS